MKGKIKHKATNVLYTLMAATLILAAGCGGSSGGGPSVSGIQTSIEGSSNVKAVKLGEAEKFAILAYSSVTSIPNSSISGKIGVMPGMREAISVDPSKEVAGGPDDMIGSDDVTVPINLLTNAKMDMLSAYNESSLRKPDANKIGTFEGKIGGKILPSGTYKWNSTVSVESNYTLHGSATDVWIFQVTGELNVAQDVKVSLSGGAQPQNIFWQVTGPVTLGAGSATAGNIIALSSITMKAGSSLKGRAFVKNGKVTLVQATVTRP